MHVVVDAGIEREISMYSPGARGGSEGDRDPLGGGIGRDARRRMPVPSANAVTSGVPTTARSRPFRVISVTGSLTVSATRTVPGHVAEAGSTRSSIS